METNFESAGPLRFLESECNWFISDMQCGRLGLNQPYRPRCVFRITIEASGIKPTISSREQQASALVSRCPCDLYEQERAWEVASVPLHPLVLPVRPE
jgi:hypothetical protein